MRKLKIILMVIVLLNASCSHAGTVLDFWHSYVHAKTQQTHYSFHLTRYKRGLFWGSCGPSTKSLQWYFNMDLAGNGPVYSSREIAISDDYGRAVIAVSGRVVTDLKQMRARIELEVESDGSTKNFIGNGEYRIEKSK